MTQTLLICIGAQKAGTTWLADYMRGHPEVHSPPVKEVHYFDARFVPEWCAKYEAEMLAEFQREAAALTLATAGDPAVQQRMTARMLRLRMIINPAEYMRFMSWGAGTRKVLFEATPDYSMLGEDGFAAMRAMHPNVKLIFLMRNPADRFWSSLKFNRTHNPAFDIDVAFDRFLHREDIRLLGDYGRTIRAARSVFGEERLHLEFYARLFTPKAIERICAFAGITPVEASFSERSNASIAGDMPEDRRDAAIRGHARVYREIEALCGGDIPDSWIADLARLEGGAGKPA